MDDTPIQAQATLAAAHSLRGLLAVARGLVEAGREVDLAGLERDAARLCAALACLPREAARPLLPEVDAALREVEALSAALRQRGASP